MIASSEQLNFMKALLTVRGDSAPAVEDKIDQYLRDLITIMERKINELIR
jgi:hypothetical protein